MRAPKLSVATSMLAVLHGSGLEIDPQEDVAKNVHTHVEDFKVAIGSGIVEHRKLATYKIQKLESGFIRGMIICSRGTG